jgi:hypothetical protein
LQSPQTVPSMPPLQNVDPDGGEPHVPSVLPVAMLHFDEQQSVSFEQTSLVCTQNDDPSWQWPPVHRCEQHSVSAVQVFPAVWHAVVSATHLPEVQVPLQQSPFAAHFAPSETQALAPHFSLTQLRLQHSVADAQLAPAGAHEPVLAAQRCVFASQTSEQQSAPVWQTSLKRWQVDGGMTGPVLESSVVASSEPDAPVPFVPPAPFVAPVPLPPVPLAPPLAPVPAPPFDVPPWEPFAPEPAGAKRPPMDGHATQCL